MARSSRLTGWNRARQLCPSSRSCAEGRHEPTAGARYPGHPLSPMRSIRPLTTFPSAARAWSRRSTTPSSTASLARWEGDEMPTEAEFSRDLDTPKGYCPPLEASEKARQSAPTIKAPPAPAAPLPPSDPPLEATARDMPRSPIAGGRPHGPILIERPRLRRRGLPARSMSRAARRSAAMRPRSWASRVAFRSCPTCVPDSRMHRC